MNHNAKKTKVCFVIATQGLGLGGHYRSLETIVKALREQVECMVINMGVSLSPVIASIPVTVHHIPFNGLNIVGTVRQVVGILKREQIDLLNVFGGCPLLVAELASKIVKKPLVFTKCGGPNPVRSHRFYPVFDHMIVFSKENQSFFQSHPRYANTEIHFLPNRATQVSSNPEKVAKLRARLAPHKSTFLIISRFCQVYKRNMCQGVDLVRCLNAEGYPCQLLIVGTPEDPDVVDDIAHLGSGNLVTVNDTEFTLNASELIDVADFVIGTGRGFMEAASRGKVLLTPLANSPFPLLITKDTFQAAFATNFSPRNQIENLDVEANVGRIIRVFEDDDYRAELANLSSRLFNDYFNVDNVVERYRKLFGTIRYRSRFRFLNLLYGLYVLKSRSPYWIPSGRSK